MSIRLQFTLSFEDYVEAQRLHAKRGWWPRLNLVLAYTLVPVMGILWILGTFFLVRLADSPAFFLFEIGVGFFFACFPLYLRMRWKRCYRRTRTEPADCTVEFDDSMIRTQAANMRSEIQWAAVRSLSENKKVFLLYIAPAKFIAIPKRICTEQTIDELRSLFKRDIGAVHQ